MAQSQQPERDGQAEFVRRIVTDPRNVPDVMRLYGYLGASSEENHDRLYLNPDLSAYIEVPTGAILHRVTASAEQDPNRGVTLWVRRDAALIYKSAPAAQALANYFAGAIAGAAAGGAAMPAIYYCVPTAVHPCTVTCPATPAAPCLTHHLMTCLPALCQVSVQVACVPTPRGDCLPTLGPVCAFPGAAAGAVAPAAAVPGAAAMAAASPLTLCGAGGGLCTPDCPTYPQRCGVTPICQPTAVCQPTRETPCVATQGCSVGCGGGGTLHLPCTVHPCEPFVPALAAAAPQPAAFAPAGQLPIGLHTRAIVSCVFACFTQICRTPQPTPCPGCF